MFSAAWNNNIGWWEKRVKKKEGEEGMNQRNIRINEERCILCGDCIDVCTRGIIELGNESARIKDPARCILCGHCKSICPEDAPELGPLNPHEFQPLPPKDQNPQPENLMSFFRSRRSVRFFKKDPVRQEDLETIVQAGRFAPTGGNRQPVCYVMLHTPEMIENVRSKTVIFLGEEAAKILAAAERHKKFGDPLPPRAEVKLGYAPLWKGLEKLYQRGKDLLFYFAPAVAVLHLDPKKASPFGTDAGLAAMQMVLMAEALGLGTCFCGFLTSALNSSLDLKKILQIPEEHDVLLSFMIGHPNVKFLRNVSRNAARVKFL